MSQEEIDRKFIEIKKRPNIIWSFYRRLRKTKDEVGM
jgi:hypothetical protein